MQFRNKVWLGAAAGAAASGIWGDKETDFQERMLEGAGLGAGVAALVDWRDVKNAGAGAAKGAWRAGNSYRRSMVSHFGELRKGGLPAWKAASGAFGRLPVLMGAGAALGAVLDSDHKRGALIGAGIGVAARGLIAGVPAWKKLTRFGKTPVAFGLSAVAYGVGSYLSHNQVTAESAYNPVTGYDERAPGSTVKDRLMAMNAGGDLVFGAHARRRS